ncbi:MAG: DUF86 domain-containing protein [Crocosphaera sp.]|nr:DUF86 domain-containing protein [Crocosphaera sp.]
MSRDKEIILDIVKACRLILVFTREMNQDDFLEDEKTQSSVLYQIIIIGEGVNRLSETFKANYPNIPFAKIKGMRNRVTHEYKEVDMEIVWKAIEKDIPELLTQLTPLIPNQ